MSASDFRRLDRFEGLDYARVEAPLTLDDGSFAFAEGYLYRDEFAHRVSPEEWDPAWFEREGIGNFLGRYTGFSET